MLLRSAPMFMMSAASSSSYGEYRPDEGRFCGVLILSHCSSLEKVAAIK